MPSASTSTMPGTKRVTGAKRGRDAWKDCEDVEELKQMLEAQHSKILALQKENRELRKASLADEEAAAADADPEALEKAALQHKKSLHMNLQAQMVYKPSLKHGRARITAEIPNLSLEDVKAVLGEELAAAAKNTPKQFTVQAGAEALSTMLGGSLYKSLRFGALLEPEEKGPKVVYSKADRQLTVSGFYSMTK